MKKGGAALAGPIWNKFITEALKTRPDDSFERPSGTIDPKTLKPTLRGFWQGNESFFVDKISGKLATEFTPPETIEERVLTSVHSILHWVDKKDVLGPPPENPENDPQYNLWEIPVQNWWAQNRGRYGGTYSKPIERDDVHIETSKPMVTIIKPNSSTSYPSNQTIDVRVSNFGYAYPLSKIDIFVNDVYLGTAEAPFQFSFIPSDLGNLQPENELKVIAYDSVYNSSETSVIFKVED